MVDMNEVNLYVKSCIDKYFGNKPGNIKVVHEQAEEESAAFMLYFD